MQSFRVIEIEKVIAKHKFVNRYRATKSAHLYCKWLCCKWACFKFSFASSHLNYSSEMQSVFLTWIQAHNLSFSIQAGFNYRLHDYFQLVYMAWKFQIGFLQTMGKETNRSFHDIKVFHLFYVVLGKISTPNTHYWKWLNLEKKSW